MKMNENWIDFWVEKNLELEDAQKEIIIFGICQGRTLLINLFTMFLISIVIDFFIEGILFLLLFIPLRSFAGGYHANTKKGCFIISNVLYLFFLFLCKTAIPNSNMVYIGILVFSTVIASYAPVDSCNKRMGFMMCRKMKVRTVFVLAVEITVLLGLDFLFASNFSGIMFYVLCMVLVLQIGGVYLEKMERTRNRC